MRYLYLLFFCFLSLHSYLVFAQAESPASCQSFSGTQWCTASTTRSCTSPNQPVKVNVCAQGGNSGNLMQCANNCQCRDGKSLIDGVCKCPAGTQWHPLPAQGTSAGVCEPITCPEGQTQTVISGGPDGNQSICADIPDGGGEEPPPETCPEGRPKVNGMCPVCPEGYNEDGTCNYPSSEPASSAPNSSSPDTGSSGSAGSAGSAGGGDDGGGTPGGGGSGPGNGGDNGGGSAASASSASGAAASSGTNNSWNPYSGYGNWIPIAPDSPCPNKYQDISGQWWCAGNGLGASSGGSASSAASNGSNSSGSAGSNSSGSSTSSSCPAKPQCKKNTGIEADDKSCKKLLQEYYSACPGNPTENGLFDLEKDELGEGRPLTFKNSLEDFKTSMSDSENVQAINDFFSFEGSGTCPVWQVQVLVFNIVIDQQCSSNIPWDLIRGVIIAVSILLAARIALH